VSLTFLVSLFILSPVKGFRLIFTGSRFFLHGVCPVLSIITFCCFIRSHMVRLWESFLPLIPVFLYAVLYLVMVVVIGEENGGWVNMSLVGNMLQKKYPDFDPKNYGYKKMIELLPAWGFEVEKFIDPNSKADPPSLIIYVRLSADRK
jgi:hypothetical protein